MTRGSLLIQKTDGSTSPPSAQQKFLRRKEKCAVKASWLPGNKRMGGGGVRDHRGCDSTKVKTVQLPTQSVLGERGAVKGVI